jgi:hypothetical protein
VSKFFQERCETLTGLVGRRRPKAAEKDMKTGPLAGVIAVLALGGSGTPTRVVAAGPIACEASPCRRFVASSRG